MENLKEKLPLTRKKPRAAPGSYEGDPTVVGQVKEEEEGRAARRKRERNRHMHSIKYINHNLVIYRFKYEGLPEYQEVCHFRFVIAFPVCFYLS